MNEIKFTNVNSYISYAINSYIDYKIFKEMYDYYKNIKQEPFQKPNQAALANNFISANISFIIFSAFSLEAYTNIIGNLSIENYYIRKDLERQKTLIKLKTIIKEKYNKKIDIGCKLFQDLKKLIDLRDKLAHDKGKVIDSYDKYLKEFENRRMDIDNKLVLKNFIDLDNYVSDIDSKLKFLFGISKDEIESWINKEKYFYSVEEKLPFSHTKFPNLHEYQLTVRIHLGFEYTYCKIDNDQKQIINTNN